MTPRPGGEPWWLREAPPDEPLPALHGDAEADVAVVGGGYTGLWTALALREREPSLRVVLLEAARCGHGPSGRNGGFLHGYWSSAPRLLRAFGRDGALALARASDAIVPAVRSFCEARGEDVWLREGGLLAVAASPAQEASLRARVAAVRELGEPGQAVELTRAAVMERCASPAFRQGVLFRDGATVQPARLVHALRRAALAAGVEIHERTALERLRRGDPLRLETRGGTLRAPVAVLAVNAALTGWPRAAPHLTNFGSYVVLTEPVPELLEELRWTDGEAIVDGRMFLHYFRTTADGRVLMGSGSGPIGRGGRLDARFTHDTPSAARAEAGLRRLLPALASARVEHAWGGPIDVASDQLPFVGTLPGSRVHYAAGFSGNGVGPSWLAAQALASLALGRDDEWTRLPLVGRTPPRLPPEPLKWLGGTVVRAALLAEEQAEEDGRRAHPAARLAGAAVRGLRLPLGRR